MTRIASQVAAIDDIIETEITGTQACVRGGRSLKVGPTRDPEVSPRINYRLYDVNRDFCRKYL